MVKSVCDGDVYSNWNTTELKFASVNVAIENISRTENQITYDLILYYGDRLLQDESNANAIVADGVNVLQTILNSLDEELEVNTPIQYTPFAQSFADYLGGVYCRVTIAADFALGNCLMDEAPSLPIYHLTLNVNDANLGSVAGAGNYREGEQVTITAIPAEGARFVSWDDGDTNAQRVITLMQDLTLTATFAGCTPQTYTTNFISDIWETEDMLWFCGKKAASFSSESVQVTKAYSGAYTQSKVNFNRVSSVVVTYFTNATTGAGSITLAIGNTS